MEFQWYFTLNYNIYLSTNTYQYIHTKISFYNKSDIFKNDVRQFDPLDWILIFHASFTTSPSTVCEFIHVTASTSFTSKCPSSQERTTLRIMFFCKFAATIRWWHDSEQPPFHAFASALKSWVCFRRFRIRPVKTWGGVVMMWNQLEKRDLKRKF